LALASSPEESLTLILLLDQISRNILRGPAAEWVYSTCDPMALHVVHHCLRLGHDKGHPPYKQMWFYLPLAKSESIMDQEMALAKVATLACDVRTSEWKACHPNIKTMLDYSIKFYTTIDRFGRFPHRNAILKRDTTEEEKLFLGTDVNGRA
jgi:uncharacterized protein (DUF924 family)